MVSIIWKGSLFLPTTKLVDDEKEVTNTYLRARDNVGFYFEW